MAKTLFLIRHAHATVGSADDMSRPLSSRGRLAAQAVAQMLSSRVTAPAGIFSSPAARALETGRIVAQALGIPAGIIEIPELYTGTEEAYFRALQLLPDALRSALIIGHNPSIAGLASRLRASGELLGDFEPAGTASLQFPGETWPELDWGLGQCRWFLNPNDGP